MNCKVIAISGPSGSGKSTLSNEVLAKLQQKNITVTVITEDHYYKCQNHLTFDERLETNYDEPAAFEHNLLAQHLAELKKQQPIDIPHYCFKTHTRLEKTTVLIPSEIILVEGILLFSDPQLLPFFDLRVYIDTPIDICLMRRILRDTRERGRDLEDIARQYQHQVKPMFHQHIEPTREHANVRVDLTHGHEDALELIVDKVSS